VVIDDPGEDVVRAAVESVIAERGLF